MKKILSLLLIGSLLLLTSGSTGYVDHPSKASPAEFHQTIAKKILKNIDDQNQTMIFVATERECFAFQDAAPPPLMMQQNRLIDQSFEKYTTTTSRCLNTGYNNQAENKLRYKRSKEKVRDRPSWQDQNNSLSYKFFSALIPASPQINSILKT